MLRAQKGRVRISLEEYFDWEIRICVRLSLSCETHLDIFGLKSTLNGRISNLDFVDAHLKFELSFMRYCILNALKVAMKIVDKKRLDAENLSKVEREISILKRLDHPYIVKLYEVCRNDFDCPHNFCLSYSYDQITSYNLS